MKPSYIGAIVIVLLSLMSITSYAADIQAGKIKSAACAGCHGSDGNSISGTWPNLAGQHASYLVKQLKNYKSGARINATMQGMVGILAIFIPLEAKVFIPMGPPSFHAFGGKSVHTYGGKSFDTHGTTEISLFS